MIGHRQWIQTGAWALLLFFVLPAGGARADICGYPRAGTVCIIRGDRAIGEFGVALAASTAQRRQGLMHCPQLAPGTGMLFTYPDAHRRVFWMKNTRIGLAIVFITADGRVAAVVRGEPGSLKRIYSPDHIASVLEVNWDEGRRIAAGDRTRFTPDPPARIAAPAPPSVPAP